MPPPKKRSPRKHAGDNPYLIPAPASEVAAELALMDQAIHRLHENQGNQPEDWLAYENITRALKERVKELTCLYGISKIVELCGFDLEKILKRIILIIPDAWQYPEITACRFRLKNLVLQSPDFMETPWMQSQDIMAGGVKQGALDVCYREERPIMDEGPFLHEERSLINVIAERVGKIIERSSIEEAFKQSELKTIALLNAIPDLMFQIDKDGVLIAFHEGNFIHLRDIGKRSIGKNLYAHTENDHLIPRRMLDQGKLYARRVLETGNPQMYEQHLSLGGKPRDYEVRMVACRKDEVLGIVRDITKKKQLEREILEISNREHRRIGQDLHDSLCQHLTGIGFMSKVLENKASANVPLQVCELHEIVDLLDQAITMTRGFAQGLNPVELQAGGLTHALSQLSENVKRLFGVHCGFFCPDQIVAPDTEMAMHLYRIVQESLNNAIKHGKAKNILISLIKKGTSCTLTISDDGLGFGKSETQGRGMGLNIMRYRASMIEAALEIKNKSQGGTDIVCCFELKETAR